MQLTCRPFLDMSESARTGARAAQCVAAAWLRLYRYVLDAVVDGASCCVEGIGARHCREARVVHCSARSAAPHSRSPTQSRKMLGCESCRRAV
jgi:hypothetical protein